MKSSIREKIEKIKSIIQSREPALLRPLLERNIYVFALVFLVAVFSFGLGRFSALESQRESVKVIRPKTAIIFNGNSQGENVDNPVENIGITGGKDAAGKYVGSKNSNKYHLPWCSGAQRITEANKVWFSTKEDAEAKGYSPAGNCEGI